MCCQDFREKLLVILTPEEVEEAVAEHGDCGERECADAIATARVLARPLAAWVGGMETSPDVDLAESVIVELQARPTSTLRRPFVAGLVGASIAAAALFALVNRQPAVDELASSRISVDGVASGEIDPVAVAYLENTERWIADATRTPIRTDFDLDLALEEPAMWFTSKLKPIADSLESIAPAVPNNDTPPAT